MSSCRTWYSERGACRERAYVEFPGHPGEAKDEAGAQRYQTQPAAGVKAKTFCTFNTLLTGGAVASGGAAFNPDERNGGVSWGLTARIPLVSKYSEPSHSVRSAGGCLLTISGGRRTGRAVLAGTDS